MAPKIVLILLAALSACSLGAQADSIGQWRSLQSFSNGSYVTEGEEDIIYTTGNALFFLDKVDLSIRTFTRADGLGGGRIELLRYHPPTATLIIVYANSTIDLLSDGNFSTLRQIDNFNFSGDKRIYDIAFGGDNRIYLAAGFGVSALDLDDRTFTFTTFTGVRVEGVTEYGGKVYAATPEGLYNVPLTGVNINDFGSWELMGQEAGLPGDYGSGAVTVWRDRLYFGVDEDVWALRDNAPPALVYDAPVLNNRLQYIKGGPNVLLTGYRCPIDNCSDRRIVGLSESGEATVLPDCAFRTNNAIEDSQGRIWFGDEAEQIRYLEAPGGSCRLLNYPGPPRDLNHRLLHDGTSLWVAPAQLDENTTPSPDLNGVYRFADEEWTALNRENTLAFRGRNGEKDFLDDFGTVVDVAYDPVGQNHYFSSFFEGVIGLDAGGEATLYDETNSTIELTPAAGPGRIRAAGAATDADGLTYFAISRTVNGGFVSVRDPEGNWATLGRSCGINTAIDVAMDPEGFVWVIHQDGLVGGGITVIDPNGTPMDPSDDRCRTFLSNNSNLPTNAIRSIAVDLDGVVWIGTTQGIVTFGCGNNVFGGEQCLGNRQAVAADDGFGGLLLETVEVRAITVDGANRKWIATGGGAFLLSADGREQLVFFDRGNSPLLDNVVNDIAINPNDGTVYFGTDLGIISFRGEATGADREFGPEIVVFPNPVEPGYGGPVAISGLARNARVKITDVSGKLVEEGTALGGQFLWQGTDYNGRRVTSGVYLVYASGATEFGASTRPSAVGKIVFLR